MLGLISFILVIIGGINWFCIGLLQFDFVAGLFGSQSSIFSRLVYIAVGLGVLVLLFNLIENKGQIKFNFKKHIKQAISNESPTYYEKPRTAGSVEASKDNAISDEKQNMETTKNGTMDANNAQNNNTEAGKDYSENDHVRHIEQIEYDQSNNSVEASSDGYDRRTKNGGNNCDNNSCKIDYNDNKDKK